MKKYSANISWAQCKNDEKKAPDNCIAFRHFSQNVRAAADKWDVSIGSPLYPYIILFFFILDFIYRVSNRPFLGQCNFVKRSASLSRITIFQYVYNSGSRTHKDAFTSPFMPERVQIMTATFLEGKKLIFIRAFFWFSRIFRFIKLAIWIGASFAVSRLQWENKKDEQISEKSTIDRLSWEY